MKDEPSEQNQSVIWNTFFLLCPTRFKNVGKKKLNWEVRLENVEFYDLYSELKKKNKSAQLDADDIDFVSQNSNDNDEGIWLIVPEDGFSVLGTIDIKKLK